MKKFYPHTFVKVTTILTSLFIICGALQGAGNERNFEEQISRSKYFSEPFLCVGTNAPSQTENVALLEALSQARQKEQDSKMQPFEDFIAQYPNSPWAPSILANLGEHYQKQGYYTRALGYWEAVWKATRDYDSGPGKRVADYCLINWCEILSTFCKVNEIEKILAETKGRQMENPQWQKIWIRIRTNLDVMEKHPELAYRCGAVSLIQAVSVNKNASNSVVENLRRIPSPGTGFSMSALVELSDRYKLDFVAVKRVSSDKLAVPSVMHFRENHYAAITSKKENLYLVNDPSLSQPRWLTLDAINAEASDYFLIPRAQLSDDFRLLASQDTDSIYGKGWSLVSPPPPPPPCPAPDDCEECKAACNPPPPPPGHGPGPHGPPPGSCGPLSRCGGGGPSAGMPTWDVVEPYISLVLNDKPMAYNMSFGSEFAFNITYRQKETDLTRDYDPHVFGFGDNGGANFFL